MEGFSHLEYIDYHRGLAEKHKKLRHGSQKTTSFISTDHNEFHQYMESGNLKGLNDIIMHLDGLRGKLSGDEIIRDTVYGGFYIYINANADQQNFRSNDKVFSEAKRIGLEIIAKMKLDSEANCAVIDQFDVSRVNYQMVGPLSQSWLGYEFTYPLKSKKFVEHNPDAWLP